MQFTTNQKLIDREKSEWIGMLFWDFGHIKDYSEVKEVDIELIKVHPVLERLYDTPRDKEIIDEFIETIKKGNPNTSYPIRS